MLSNINNSSYSVGAILGYYVYYRLQNSFTDVSARLTIVDIRHCNVTGLDEK